MATESLGLSNEDFLKLAVKQQLLTPEEAAQVTSAVRDSDLSVPAFCIQKGLLRPVQVDVIHGLADADNLAPGYEVIDLLGYGGLGIVYRVRQPKLDRLVALKTIPMQRIENPAVIARFQQEARAIGKLKHPNIVAAYDFGTHRDRLYLAMELVEGTDLDGLIGKSGRLHETLAWALAQQAAAGLSHAAQHNLVHRDIKPGNLLLTRPPAGYPLPAGVPLLKITDFGLVQLETSDLEGTRLTLTGTSLGTPHYMAPEQVADAHVDSRADIYALGATVFHMLSGQPPFEGKSVGQVLAAKLKGSQAWVEKLPSGTSRETVALLKQMLAQDPEQRIANYETLLNRIKHILDGDSDTHAIADLETVESLLRPESSITLELDSPSETDGKRWKLAALLGAVVVAIGLGSVYVTSDFSGASAIPTSQLTPSGWERALFNGTDLEGWTAIRGSWSPTQDDMGARVLSGKGSVVHALPGFSKSPATPLDNFGVRFKIDLQSAETAELHFEHQDIKDDSLARKVVRMTSAGVVLGAKESKAGEFRPASGLYACDASGTDEETSHYQELRLERHNDHWRLLVNGKPACFEELESDQPPESIQLVADGGKAYFADLSVYELADRKR